MKLKIKKGQKVKVIAGNDKGKTGEVIEINSSKLQVKVSGIAMRTHFDKKNSTTQQKEAFIDYSNIAAVK